jgi:hypothetical protein
VFLLVVGDNTYIKLMQKRGLWRYSRVVLLAVFLAVGGGTGTVFAVTSNSTNYQVTETEFGSGSTHQNCSAQYCAKTSIGDSASGDTASSGTTATFGSITSDDPLLEVIIDPGQSNLGDLDTEHTATKTTTVKIRSYQSDGYTMQLTGNPPQYNGHSLHTSSTPMSAPAGTEFFGINAAANTLPSVGADPVQVPSGQFSFGVVNDDYKTPNKFKYISGDTVVHSATQSGETDYTISMVVNISNATPAGHYSGDFSAVVVPVY